MKAYDEEESQRRAEIETRHQYRIDAGIYEVQKLRQANEK
jgi:hypothetical protein